MPRVRIEVVGAEAGAHQLGGGVSLPDRPLTRAEHPDGGRAFFLQRLLGLHRHHVEGFVPTDGRKFTVLGIGAVLFPKQRSRQPVAAVHDLG
jgi:hypothetical protein